MKHPQEPTSQQTAATDELEGRMPQEEQISTERLLRAGHFHVAINEAGDVRQLPFSFHKHPSDRDEWFDR